jgi:hypothetical protein
MELTTATRDRVSAFMMASRVETVVGALQAIYVLVLPLGLGVIILAAKGSAHYPPETWACVALGFEGHALTYLGLRLRKPWVVPLIVWESAYLMTPSLSKPPEGLTAASTGRLWPPKANPRRALEVSLTSWKSYCLDVLRNGRCR